ncbi:MAG: efflux RND transporter permease subunit [Planctomycetota bacterium]
MSAHAQAAGASPSSAAPGPEKGLFAWFATNHVAANLMMLGFLVFGGIFALRTQVSVFPDIDPRTVRVSVVYPGATPVEIEEGICRRVEEALSGIQGIERVRSVASEGLGTVTAELEDDAVDKLVLDDVKSAVDSLRDFPPREAENPRIEDVDLVRPVVTVAVHGAASERTLREFAQRVRDELAAREGISLVEVQGTRDYEVSIEVSEAALRRRGLTFQEVADAVSSSSVNLPGGSIRAAEGELLLRTDAQAYVARDFEQIVVRSGQDGSVVRVADVAFVRDGFEDVDVASRFNGDPAVYVAVKAVGKQQVLEIESSVKDYVAGLAVPSGVTVEVWRNQADILKSRIELLLRNGLLGLVLVFGVLVLFLDLRLAFWTTMGIPISFLGAFLIIQPFGASINMISLFAFILVLGIVVDDAIVVGESIFSRREAGMPAGQAALEGLRAVFAPVLIGVLTTMIAFLPLYFTTGFFGDILWVVPIVVISVLFFSLIESLFILPAHLSGGRVVHRPGALTFVQDRLRRLLESFVARVYIPTLRVALRFRYATTALALTTFLLVIGMVRGGVVRFVLFPSIDADDVSVRLEMLQGTPAAETEAALERIVAAAEAARGELEGGVALERSRLVRRVAATLGSQPFGGNSGPAAGASALGSHVAEVAIALVPSEERDITSAAFVARWRERVGEIVGASSLVFNSSLLSAGKDVQVELSHADVDQLLLAVEAVKRYIADKEGVVELDDSFVVGKRELAFALNDAGIAAGLNPRALAQQVRQAYRGAEVQRVQRGRDEVLVLVRYSEDERRALASLDDFRVRLPNGGEAPLSTIASWTEGRGYASIDRSDRRRIVTVTADIDEERGDAKGLNEALRKDILPALVRDIPGLGFSFEGAERERMDSLASLAKAMGFALLAMFGLLAAQLRSYIQPLIILSVIPLGVVGAVIGHVVLGYDLSFFSMFGIVALSGVVINDSVVLLDRMNQLRAELPEAFECALEAARSRFRAVLFTSLTTFVGLAPMVMEKSVQAKFLIPMAISLSAGVAFATLITLLLVPALYMVREDVLRAKHVLVARATG